MHQCIRVGIASICQFPNRAFLRTGSGEKYRLIGRLRYVWNYGTHKISACIGCKTISTQRQKALWGLPFTDFASYTKSFRYAFHRNYLIFCYLLILGPLGELGKSYCKRVKKSVTGKASVDKLHYLGEYVNSSKEVMNECQIKESFETVGLVPYDPKKVILEYTCLSQSRPHTPSPSPSPSPLMTTKEIPAEEPKTPTSLEELRQLKKQFYLCSRRISWKSSK
ncbi:hypothetical protein HF325_005331 [Metschnikowia pulcherrima]|uniref:Uncharacterized protein n=1 Tax=Metschnikowia pulcherrima TaxID=27326 RepID=A0A8H7LCT6_9ASCO|nr:hypothetical protein HF325_005331 [Metschnikowia pulcherrima]